MEALEDVLHFNLAAAPPGAHAPRATGNAKLEDLAQDPVGPRGVRNLLHARRQGLMAADALFVSVCVFALADAQCMICAVTCTCQEAAARAISPLLWHI